MSEPIIRIRNAQKYYNKGKSNEIHVMNNVSLELPESGMVAVFGRSGCGKTTLLTAIGGLDSIAGGSIELFGQNIHKHTDTLRNRYVGYIFQNYNLNPRETVFENVSAALRLCGMTDADEIHTRTMAALRNVDMDKYRDRTPDTLSGGQQQRVAIARAIVKSPAIILADEPTGNLDEENTVLVMDILKELSRTRLVLLVTHEADLVDHYCDRVIEIVDGKIHSDRTNKDARGYIQRSKNDIYLGELTRTETKTPGVTLEYYGEIGKEITLRLVNRDGRLYLRSSDPTVQLLDDRSEVQLVEGVFEAEPTAESTPRRSLDLSALTPFEGKRFGRLFGFKNALASAWRENFSSKKKAGRVLLSICLILLAMTLVLMTATVGTGLESFIELRGDHDDSLFYIPMDPTVDYSAVMDGMGNEGMECAAYVSTPAAHHEIQFRASTFMTAKAVYLTAAGFVGDVRHAEGLVAVAGKNTVENTGDVLITTAVADKMLEDSPVGYLDGYEDLVGMVSRYPQYSMGDIYLRIAGVVESDRLFMYVGSMEAARHTLKWEINASSVSPSSASPYGKTLKEGEILLIEDEYRTSIYKVGDTIEILGKAFTVADIVREYTNVDAFHTYVAEEHGVALTPNYTLYAEKTGLPPSTAFYAWYLEEQFPYMPQFCEGILTACMRQGYLPDFAVWAVGKHQSIAAYAELMKQDPVGLCAAYLYHADKGSYPTDGELQAFVSIPENKARLAEMLDTEALQGEYDEAQKNYYGGDFHYYVVSDTDYIALASSAGRTTDTLDFQPYYVWEGFGTDKEYSHYFMISSSDPNATEAFLTELLGDDGFLSPKEVFRDQLVAIELLTIIGFVGILVVLALMCLCMYFIMHAIFVSRIREVGILRAIGVTKKNILFRFGVETALITVLTVALGFVLSAWGVMSLIETPVFASIFFFPPWMAILLFGVLMVAAMIFGLLPALSLLRKTPAAILAKYDI